MKHFESKRKLKKRIYSAPVIFILVVILAFLVHGTLGIYQKVRESKNELAIASEKFQEYKNREDQLNKEIEKVKSPIGREEKVRSDFFLSKDEERAVFIIDQDNDEEEAENKSKKGSFWQKIGSWFE